MAEFWGECSECGSLGINIKVTCLMSGNGTTVGRKFMLEDVVSTDPEIVVTCSNCEADVTLGFTEKELDRMVYTILENHM